jgi:2-hydroxy-3-oxopropionate reductase
MTVEISTARAPQVTSVGFIGLGIMGKPMALNLIRAGYHLTVCSRSRLPVDQLVAAGASAGDTPVEVARASDVVITMLPDTPDVEQVLFGTAGVSEGLRSGAVVIDMSTISPGATRLFANRLRQLGARMLDAPVSGGQKGAEEATLSVMVGGDPETFETCRPLFEALGRNVVHIGPSGAGQVCKAANQIVVAVTVQAVAEALALARRSGVDPARVRQALLGGFAASRVLEVHGRRMLDRTYEPGFRSRLHRKDLAIALAAAREAGVTMPATALVGELMTALLATGRGDLDSSALALLIEELSGGNEAVGSG